MRHTALGVLILTSGELIANQIENFSIAMKNVWWDPGSHNSNFPDSLTWGNKDLYII